MTQTALQDTVKDRLEAFGVNTAPMKGLDWAVVMGQLAADELLTSTDNDEWRDWVDGLLEQHKTWRTNQWRRRRNVADLSGEFTNVDGDGPTDDELAEHRFLIVEHIDGQGDYLHSADSDAEIANALYGIANEENPGYVEYVYDLDMEPETSCIYEYERNDVEIIQINTSTYRATGSGSTENGYDRLWIHAINQVLDDRGADVRIKDIDDEIWDQFIGPLVDYMDSDHPSDELYVKEADNA